MAVANSTTQLIVPGLDASVQTNLNTVLNGNATIAAIQSNLAIGGSLTTLNTALTNLGTSVASLPQKEAYPTFAIWSNYNNTPRATIYNSDMKKIGNSLIETNSEIYADWTGTNYTNTYRTSESWTSYWWAMTNMSDANGHSGSRVHQGQWTHPGINPDQLAPNYMPFFGTVIGQTGVRQKFSLWQQNDVAGIYQRGGTLWFERISLNNSLYATWYGGTSYGMSGYNDRTRTLVVIEAKDGSNNYRMHIWKNTGTNRSLNSANYWTGTLKLFLQEAKAGLTTGGSASYVYYDFQWQANGSNSYDESRYRMTVVPGDNNVIGLRRSVPSNGSYYATYTPSSQTLNTTFNGMGNTTSYGYEQGSRYHMQKYQITWDNYWVAAYNHYYYYGSGINIHFIDTRDPRNYYIGQWGSSSGGAQLVPFKSNKFLMSLAQSNSNDNVGATIYGPLDPEGARLNGRVTSGTIANGGTINITEKAHQGMFDTWYTSTNYPFLMPMPHWRVNV